MMRQINLRVPEELLARIEVARGRVPRESWLRWAVEQALGSDADRVDVPDSSPRESVVASAAGSSPAEPPVNRDYIAESYRSSSFAKRDVRPVPKRGA